MKKLKLDLSTSINKLKIVSHRLVNSNLVGGYASVFKGSGLEFADYRKYDQSDDASRIDWKASSRTNQLLVKEFVEERNLSVFFLIDVSSSMLYSSTDKLKIEYAAELIATLSYTIINAGDSIGFALFNDNIVEHVSPKTGFKQHFTLLKSLVDPRYYGGKYDLSEALRFSLAALKQSAIVIIISDFIGLKNNWKSDVRILGKKFDLIGIMIRDSRDFSLPDYHGNVTLGDVFTNRQMTVDIDSVRVDYEKAADSRLKELHKVFSEAGSDFISLNTDTNFIKPISDLFMERYRRHK